MTEEEIIINKIAQDKFDFDEGINWFNRLEKEKQKDVLNKLTLFIQQSHPTKETVDLGLETAPIKKTMTPVIIFKTQKLTDALTKMRTLPEDEWRKSFVTMLSVFRVADTRRRETLCKDGCTHEWHNLKLG
jgi:hypothetical protein